MDYLTKAIQKLKPTAEFSYSDDDYSTIKWDVLEGEAPTTAQIDQAIAQIKANQSTEIKEKEKAKAVLLERLGLTQEEFNILTS